MLFVCSQDFQGFTVFKDNNFSHECSKEGDKCFYFLIIIEIEIDNKNKTKKFITFTGERDRCFIATFWKTLFVYNIITINSFHMARLSQPQFKEIWVNSFYLSRISGSQSRGWLCRISCIYKLGWVRFFNQLLQPIFEKYRQTKHVLKKKEMGLGFDF